MIPTAILSQFKKKKNYYQMREHVEGLKNHGCSVTYTTAFCNYEHLCIEELTY